MAILKKTILISETIIVIVYWFTIFLVPHIFSFHMRGSMHDFVEHVPFDLSLLCSLFTLWFDVHVMQFHRQLLRGLALKPRWFNASKIPLFIFTAGRMYTGVARNREAELIHHSICMGVYNIEMMRRFPRLSGRVDEVDKSLPQHKYTPLRYGRAIRTLRLDPSASDTAPIVCSLKQTILDLAPSFEALSYSWDDDQGDEQIICDGAALRVSKNCLAALRRIRIRQGKVPTRLWVDVICINQGSDKEALEEREKQLEIMGEIYKKAEKVVVWLGEHDESSKLVCDFFEAVAESYKSRRASPQTSDGPLQIVRRWREFDDALAQFFNRSWFTRMWPIQEVTLPRRGRTQLVCGNTEMPFENLRLAWDFLKYHGLLPIAASLDQAVALQFYLADAIALKRGRGQESTSMFSQPLITDLSQFSLAAVMNSTRYKACKYPKDKFFALYGVFQELGIPCSVTPSVYHSRSDADILKAVMLFCLELEGRFDVLCLSQLGEPYHPSDDFVQTRQDPYDSLTTAVFSMTRRLVRVCLNIYKRQELDYVPKSEWRTDLPSWVPDWTHWTAGTADARYNIKFPYSDSSASAQVLDRVATSPPPPQHTDPVSANATCRICSAEEKTSEPSACRGLIAHYDVSASALTVEAKIVGTIIGIGSVDSVAVLWQTLAPKSLSAPSQWKRGFSRWIEQFHHSSPDPALSALVETMRNFVWRSNMAQVFISMRMAVKTLSFIDIIAYMGAIAGVLWSGPWSKELICMRHSLIASCPTDGYTMRKQAKRGGYAETHFLTNMFNNVVHGREPWNSDMWYDFVGTILATLAYLLWDCRASISECLFGGGYDDMNWWIVTPVYIYIMSALVQAVARRLGDTAFLLLGRAVTALSIIWGFVVFLVWARTMTIPFLVIIVLRACHRLTWRVWLAASSDEVRLGGSDTHGMHFFSTEAGITGSTRGPVREKDLLVLVRNCSGYLIIRQRGKGFVVVGSAYVGNCTRQATEKLASDWNRISLY